MLYMHTDLFIYSVWCIWWNSLFHYFHFSRIRNFTIGSFEKSKQEKRLPYESQKIPKSDALIL